MEESPTEIKAEYDEAIEKKEQFDEIKEDKKPA